MDSIANTVSDSIGQKFNHYLNRAENMSKLKRKCEELNYRKEDVELRMNGELRQGKKPKKEVILWFNNVQRINEEVRGIESEVGEENTVFKRASQGEVVFKMIQAVEELHEKGNFVESLVLDAPPLKGEKFPPPKVVGETTTIRKMNEIWDLLMNDETGLIGVYGIGGVGKTTIMKQINNRLLEQTEKFESVIWVTVSKVFNVIKLQDCIASKLKLNLSDDEDEMTRAGKLFAGLEEKKRCVLILDDVWEAIELENVGIPEPTGADGFKIVLTTRSLDVCRKMKCKDIKIELLSKEEAWNFFLDIVGRQVLRTSSLEATVKLVAEECACLPLAIKTLAGSMRGVVDECEWRNVLRQLREATEGFVDMEKVFEQLKYSYIRLKGEKLRHCLLYCALYPEDFEIERKELIKYLIDEGIIEKGLYAQRKVLFDEGHSILNKLENACLLESVEKDDNKKYVKMHDLIRDMALQIMGRGCMVKAGVHLREIPYKEQWTVDLERVSLMNNYISEIRSGVLPRCYRLSTLLLLGNGGLRSISDSFFMFMCGLRVLDLSHTRIEILPDSISDLENLTALLLRWCCNLKYVPSLAKLKALNRLDLGGSGIEQVPEGLEMLINLTYLNLNAEYLEVLPTGILPKLSKLQFLIVWWASKTLKISASEFKDLRFLTTLAGQFHDLYDFNKYIIFYQRTPQNYLLQLGPHGHFLDFDEEGSYFSKYVGLTGCCISNSFELPQSIQELEIRECHDVKSLCKISTAHEINRLLKYCKIIKCDGIECVLSCPYQTCPVNESLEVLHLEDLKSCHILYPREAAILRPRRIFSCLKELCISKCPNMRTLFMVEMLPNLENLEEINVENCWGMEEIIAEAEQETGESSNQYSINTNEIDIPTLPKLKRLTLEDLPELKSIVYSQAVLVCDSLQILTILSCPKLGKLPLHLSTLNGQPDSHSALLQVEINDREWWESLEWDPPSAKDVIEPFLLHIS